MKSLLQQVLSIFLIAGTSLCSAQNLVLNAAFESYTYPPTGSGLLLEDFVPNWASYYTTPDYFSTEFMGEAGMLDYCGTLPHSGKGIIGGYVLGYYPSSGYNREYLQGELTEPLKPNTLYYAEMYVKPMLNAPVINFGIDKIGMALTDKHYHYEATLGGLIVEVPEVENNNGVITEMTEWTKVSGCFIAKGGETKIIIGNFRKDSETDTIQLPGAFGEEIYKSGLSYFLFDDILVKEMPAAYILPGDTIACRDSLVILTAYPEGGAYNWSNGASTQSVQTNKAGTFTVNITTKEGCKLTASAGIKTKFCGPVCPVIFLPNAFSPNNDGNNDYFEAMNGVDMISLEISIYNRFGARVFYGNGLNTKWDGQAAGKACDVGTYYYYCRYEDCHGTPMTKKGDIALVR